MGKRSAIERSRITQNRRASRSKKRTQARWTGPKRRSMH
jgi:DNA invertase Pin-like site-specific DNA recombinase